MNLYLISQSVNNDYDTYSDAVVAAEDEEQARSVHPRHGLTLELEDWQKDTDIYDEGYWWNHNWAPVEQVKVELLGKAKDGTKVGVVCASFHAG